MRYRVPVRSEVLSEEGVRHFEKKYDADYVFDSVIRSPGGFWTDTVYAIFYQKNPHPRRSNYFGITVNAFGHAHICDGISATEPHRGFFVVDTGEVFWSVSRHDYRKSKCGRYFVDGGRDYMRHGHAPGLILVDIRVKLGIPYAEIADDTKIKAEPLQVRPRSDLKERSDNYVGTFDPYNPWQVKRVNKILSQRKKGQRVVLRGRLGKNNPQAWRCRGKKEVPLRYASRIDVYICDRK